MNFGLHVWRTATIAGLIALPAAAYGLGRQGADTAQRVDRSQDAIAYICSTTSVLDSLVTAAADQIQLNLDNGTYAKLRKQGIITTANIRAAQDTLHQYRAAHATLTRDVSCEGL